MQWARILFCQQTTELLSHSDIHSADMRSNFDDSDSGGPVSATSTQAKRW
jgi:hypothetical protein